MTFQDPNMLLSGAFVACAISGMIYAALRRRSYACVQHSNLQFFEASVRARVWPGRLLGFGWIAALALMVMGAAHPLVRAWTPVHDGTVVLCVDTSGSMAAADVRPSRADAALAAMKTFAAQTPQGTAIGLVSFSTAAQAIIRPTRDRTVLESAFEQIPSPNGATAIGDALSLAQDVLPKRGGHRVVVLITDGENNAGIDPLGAARSLAQSGAKLYTIGIGTNAGALIPGTLQTAGIDEDALRAYAAATGGAYSRASDATQLRQALAALGRSTSYERATLDISDIVLLSGAVLMSLTFAAGLAAGRIP
jgi:Ca-activated chloride channel family protein